MVVRVPVRIVFDTYTCGVGILQLRHRRFSDNIRYSLPVINDVAYMM